MQCEFSPMSQNSWWLEMVLASSEIWIYNIICNGCVKYIKSDCMASLECILWIITISIDTLLAMCCTTEQCSRADNIWNWMKKKKKSIIIKAHEFELFFYPIQRCMQSAESRGQIKADQMDTKKTPVIRQVYHHNVMCIQRMRLQCVKKKNLTSI